jgi:hypothetical protein
MQEVWICGRYFSGSISAAGVAWELRGVFSTEAKAEAACVLPADFIGAVRVDEVAPDEPTALPRCRYPLAERGFEVTP